MRCSPHKKRRVGRGPKAGIVQDSDRAATPEAAPTDGSMIEAQHMAVKDHNPVGGHTATEGPDTIVQASNHNSAGVTQLDQPEVVTDLAPCPPTRRSSMQPSLQSPVSRTGRPAAVTPKRSTAHALATATGHPAQPHGNRITLQRCSDSLTVTIPGMCSAGWPASTII